MISRRSARAIAELMEVTFRKYHRLDGGRGYYSPNTTKLYDFLYDNAFDAWFCNSSKDVSHVSETRKLKEFFMKLHTGETVATATPKWSWEQRELLGQRYLAELAEDVLDLWKVEPAPWPDESVSAAISAVRRSLELDGYSWDGKRLIPPEADALDAREEAGVVQTLYREAGLADEETTFHHLSLTAEHYLAGRWDDSIANSRKFLESVLRQIAVSHGTATGSLLKSDDLARPVKVRDYLEREHLLEAKEKQAVAAVYGLLSETGGHPYVAHQEQARLLRHLALTFSQFALLRLKSACE